MNEYLKKYLSGEIDGEKLEKIRKISDSELFDAMHEDWEESFSEVAPKPKTNVWKKLLIGIAAVLVPLLIVSTVLLWNRTNVLSSQDIVVATGANGERATVTLPDGSEVSLNSNSTLSYKPEDFTGDTRSVTFEGEGFFSVAKSDKKRFIVHTSLIDVNVKGTTFNLLSRNNDRTASVYLESGKVELSAVASGRSIEMIPGEYVHLDAKGTGFIKEEKKDPVLISSWRLGEFIFIDQSLREVTKSLEYNFNTDIYFETPELGDIHFTGTLPNSNLLESVHILELSLGLKCMQKGDAIIFSAKK